MSGGRKTKMTELNVKKLKEVFALDGSVEEACMYAEISRTTYYNWINANPEEKEKINTLRQRPVLAARQRAVQGVKESYSNAMDYLTRKKAKEFNRTQHVDITTNDESINKKEDSQAVDDFHRKLVENRNKRNLDKAKQEGEL